MKAHVVYGPPGTGKTTYLVKKCEELTGAGNRVLFISHTRAAAYEAKNRINSNLVDVSTIHSLAYRITDTNKFQVVDKIKLKQFGKQIGFPIVGGDVESDEGIDIGDKLLGIYQLAVNTLSKPKEVFLNSDRPSSLEHFKFFYESYESWKESFGYIDFNDMLLNFPDNRVKYPNVIIDESQDLSPLQWEVIHKLVPFSEIVYLAGDDDQCQPAGTQILTCEGNKNIECLKNGDTVMSYSQQKGYYVNKTIKITNRQYNGQMVKVNVDGHISRYTANHKCMVKFNHNGGSKYFKCYANNLNPDLHFMAKIDTTSKSLEWHDFTIDKYNIENMQVYSLDVDKTNTYFADNIYTHNSIYAWGGANPKGMFEFTTRYKAKTIILDQSYRVPRSIWSESQNLIKKINDRVDKQYLPKEFEGNISRYGDIGKVPFDKNTETLVLYRNHMFRKEIEAEIISQGLPYKAESGFPSLMDNKYGKGIAAFKLFVEGVYDKTTLNRLMVIIKPKHKNNVAQRNNKKFTEQWWKYVDVPFRWLRYYQSIDLQEEPKISLSSIHGSKGREAERVILHTGMTQRTWESLDYDPDSEIRVFYVAMTRAIKQLDIVYGFRGFDLI